MHPDPDQAYINYLKSVHTSARPLPIASMEIYLLDQAQDRLYQREVETLRKLADQFEWAHPRSYEQDLREGATVIVTDAQKKILWANHRFLTMTGYSVAEAIGRTPHFLQGTQTDARAVQRLSESLKKVSLNQKTGFIYERLVNYRKDGGIYVCDIAIDPLRNHGGELTHFVAVEREVV